MRQAGHQFMRTALAVLTAGFLVVSALAEKAPTIPPGTEIRVRVIDTLNSDTAKTGDVFQGTLDEPVTVNGKVLYPKGADVNGRVVDVRRSGRLSEPGELDLVLTTIRSGNLTSSVAVEPLVIKGESHAKSNVTKIGGGAALGAIIGGIAGGGKGAAIGAGVGGAAGTGAAAATGKREAKVEPESLLTFLTTSAAISDTVPAESTTPPALKSRAATETATANPASAAPTSPRSDSASLFTLRDRRVIRACLAEHASELPPGTVQREAMPSGQERDLRAGGTLPNEVQTNARSLPLACDQQLPRLPADQDRIVYKGRVMLTDSSNRILDMFYVDESQ